MRLINYLNESKLPDIIRDCKPILKILKKADFSYYIYRASRKDIDTIEKITTRKDRRPTDTPIELHKVVDDMFKKKFGWKVRSEGVFAASQHFINFEEYGDLYFFFPIGQFKFVWSKEIPDLYEMFDWQMISYYRGEESRKEVYWQNYWKYKQLHDLEIEFDEYIEKNKKIIDKSMNTILEDYIKTYTDRDLISALGSGHEISFKCDKYYMVRSYKETWNEIKSLYK